MAKINRRKFFTNAAVSAAGIMIGGDFIGGSSGSSGFSDFPSAGKIMEEVRKYRKIDSHAHVWSIDNGDPETTVDYANRLGIGTLLISNPVTKGQATPDEFRAHNDIILKAMKLYPDRFIGQLTLNPTYKKESLEEIKRCVDQGMVGLKVYKQVKINDPLFFPIIEKFIDLKMIILMHSGVGYSRVKRDLSEPSTVSVPEDFVDIAGQYPEAMFQFAHLGGGPDWQYACKALKDSPNVFADLSGSNNAANMIDFALEQLGEDRLLFGCDNSYYQGVGSMLSAKLNEVQRRKIFFENYNNILRKAGKNVG